MDGITLRLIKKEIDTEIENAVIKSIYKKNKVNFIFVLSKKNYNFGVYVNFSEYPYIYKEGLIQNKNAKNAKIVATAAPVNATPVS